MRLLGISVGLGLMAVYLTMGDPFGLAQQCTLWILSAIGKSDYPFASFFAQSTFRAILLLLPALACLVWGLAPFLQADRMHPMFRFLTRRSLLVACVSAILASALVFSIATFVLGFHPITLGDEHSYVFQAKLFQSGRFYAPLPPEIEPFRNRAFVLEDRWYGIGFGGHPLWLTVGLWLGSAHVTPILFAGASVLLTYVLVRTLADAVTALVAALMVAMSPLMLLYHATLLPGPSSLVMILSVLVCVALGRRRGSLAMLALAAAFLGAATVTRPQTAMLVGVPVAVWLLVDAANPMRWRWRAVSLLAFGGVLGVLGLYGYSHLVSGDPFGAHLSPGYHYDEFGGAGGLGFRNAREFAGAVVDMGISVVKLNFVLLGWPLSWLAIVLWLVQRGKRSWELALGAGAAGLFVLYFLYRARMEQYFLEAGYLLVVLGAVGLVRVYRAAEATPRAGGRRRLLVSLVLCSYLVGAVAVWPDRLDYFRERAAHEAWVWDPIERAGLRDAIVFLDGLPPANGACVGGNSPDLDDAILLANVKEASEVPGLLAHFPNRTPYRLVADTSTTRFRLLPYEGLPATRPDPVR